MNNHTLQKIFITAVTLAVTSYSTVTLAHDQNGTLGLAAGATDYYVISCSDDGNGAPSYLEFLIMDVAPVATPSVSAQVTKQNSNSIANTTDAVDGNAAYSPELIVKGGAGSYYVAVNKNKRGTETYTFQYHCMSASNEHTGTTIAPLQNQ